MASGKLWARDLTLKSELRESLLLFSCMLKGYELFIIFTGLKQVSL